MSASETSAKGSARVAVVMGDLVLSRAKATAALHRTFNTTIEALNADWRDRLVSPLTITLGDEFQGMAKGLSAGFDLMREARLRLLEQNVACRFVLGAATIESPLNREKAWNMMGPGLSEARALLNDKSEPSAYRFSLPDAPLLQDGLNAQGYAMSYVESLWTETQRDYFFALHRKGDATNAALAKRLGVSTRNLYNVLRAGHRDLYERQIETIARTLLALDGDGSTR